MDYPEKMKILYSIDPNYEYLLTEVYFDDLFVYAISVDAGLDNMTVVTPGANLHEPTIQRSVPIDWLMKSLELAKSATYRRHTLPPPKGSWGDDIYKLAEREAQKTQYGVGDSQ
ncbi:hypothetical protein ABHV46_05630 [Asaia sp. BMEF1]|uniref:hypothetical protein n=1 Tax=Asaia sp. BMEF1 TaxID=3155932 RepID=UPI003F671A4F